MPTNGTNDTNDINGTKGTNGTKIMAETNGTNDFVPFGGIHSADIISPFLIGIEFLPQDAGWMI